MHFYRTLVSLIVPSQSTSCVLGTSIKFFIMASSVGLLFSWASLAKADEPIKATEPMLMSEPGEVVDVVDAFDTKNNDPFDMHISLGFHQQWINGKVRRESDIGPDGLRSNAGFMHNIENVGSYKQTISTLNIRTDIGLYHDLGLFVRLPIILADNRSLDGVDAGRNIDTANGAPLFKLPFNSPSRSGIDFIAVGLRWSPINQFRDPSKPTITFELEGRFGVGDPLRACNANPDQVSAAANQAANQNVSRYPQCSTPGAVVDDGKTYYRDPRDQGSSPGISRATNAIRLSFLASNRFRYVEPYGGLWFMAEFQKQNSAFGNYDGIDGAVANHPPLQGGLTAGIMVHPWENRENYQRFSIDFRFNGKYTSQGRDYSPLFDALGSSNAPSLVAPNPASYRGITDGSGRIISVGNFSKTVNFTGITEVESHGEVQASLGFIIQAAKYIKFSTGLGISYVQPYLVTTSDACNPNITPGLSEGRQGRCQSSTSTGATTVTGVPNPNHRPVIDLPGRRFRIADTLAWDLWLSGTVMF